jgi:hypothetical protein
LLSISERQRQSFWLPNSESATAQLAADSESATPQFFCRFMNRQQLSFWLPISDSATAQLAADI